MSPRDPPNGAPAAGGPAPGPDLATILRQARRALRRAALVEASLALGAVVLGTWVLGAVGVWAGLSDTATVLLEVTCLSAGLAAVLWRYALPSWRAAKSDAAVAQALDRVAARGSAGAAGLLSAVELARDHGRFGESAVLGEVAIAAAASRYARLGPERLVEEDARPRWRRVGFGFGGAVGAVLLLALLGPGHLKSALSALTATGTLKEALERLPPEPRLGDFRLTLRFPAYTERLTRVMTGPAGSFRALPGTEVTIETSARWEVSEAALLVSHGEETEQSKMAVAVDGRRLKATLVVSRSGRYRFQLRTTDGELFEERRGHDIELEIDEPPEVTLLEPKESPLEVNEKDRVPLIFEAKDDFALGEAMVSWRVLGTAKEGKTRLTGASSGQKRFAGGGNLDLAELGLQPGDRLAYTVEVRDNDTVSGPKVGASETKELRIYSKKAHHAQVMALQEQALDELVHILGDNLEAPAEASDGDTFGKLLLASLKIVDRALTADELLRRTVEAVRKDPLGRPQVAEAFEQARAELSRDAQRQRRTVTAAKRAHEKDGKHDVNAGRGIGKNREVMVTDLEKNVVYLADLMNDQRLIDAEALAKDLREQQQALKDALKAYKDAPTPEQREVLAKAIQDIRQRIAEIGAEMAKLKSSIPQDFVNQDALQGQDEAGMDRIQQMIEEGDLESALEALEQMLGQTEKMLSQLQEGREELSSREYSEITETAQRIWKNLEQLQKEQRDLANRTEAISKSILERMKSRLGDADSFVEKQKRRLEQAKSAMEKARPGDQHMPDADLFEMTERRLEDGMRALEARDFGAAQEVLQRAAEQMAALEHESRRRSEQARRFGDFFGMGDHAERAEKALRKAKPQVDEVLQDIQALMPSPSSLLSQEERAQLERQKERQGELEERAHKIGEDLEKLGQQLPIVGPEVKGMLGEAAGKMSEAKGSMGNGDAPSALNQERAALEKLKQLSQELEKMGQQGGGGSGGGVPLPFGNPQGGQGQGGRQEGRDPSTLEKVEIPKPEQYKAPAEFREDILEAAKQGTVEAYRDAVRRYYEELVK